MQTFSHAVEYNLGEEVFSRTDTDAHGIVVGIVFRPDGVKYLIAWGIGDEAACYAIELQREKKISA